MCNSLPMRSVDPLKRDSVVADTKGGAFRVAKPGRYNVMISIDSDMNK